MSEGVVSKEQRKACWAARDEYYHCCATKGKEACDDLKKKFYEQCPTAWVRHFERRHMYDQYRQKLLTQGYKLKEKEDSESP
ncbi:hypothetical protein PTSG_11412 [Salpingoeca rosetta]|uniref:Cytochrome c oxidase assembly factor 6 homolog n=1 Tax=Salpingoeca rosetta (strain ATCC 50818 / BSB-021) TaxID=946362 RepID=F2UTC7_SALR5|nr:uncharacterized protein PTSG_11412 [Salpingoeca rosetta]EGD82380.1 hypothetical protein PTSG_11412 [Salpingoeca rosetta]|eukprot:XP_004987574.1 hypothetical protein PTSG_11412 [Salpingoeca rosetta]